MPPSLVICSNRCNLLELVIEGDQDLQLGDSALNVLCRISDLLKLVVLLVPIPKTVCKLTVLISASRRR